MTKVKDSGVSKNLSAMQVLPDIGKSHEYKSILKEEAHREDSAAWIDPTPVEHIEIFGARKSVRFDTFVYFR